MYGRNSVPSRGTTRTKTIASKAATATATSQRHCSSPRRMAGVDRAEPAQERILPLLVAVAEEERRQHRHHEQGEEQRPHQGKHHRQGHRPEEQPLDARQRQQRQVRHR